MSERRRRMLAGMVLAPHAVALCWLVLVALPTTSLGDEHASRWLLGAALGAFGVWLFATSRLARVRSHLARNATLAGFALAWILLPIAAVLLHTIAGTPRLWADSCLGTSVLAPSRCQGRDHSFLHGQERYLRVEGRVIGDLCARLARTTDTRGVAHCEAASVRGFRGARCERFGLRADWSCYECQEQAGNGAFSYFVYGFDRVCRQGVALRSTNVIPERIQAVVEGAPEGLPEDDAAR